MAKKIYLLEQQFNEIKSLYLKEKMSVRQVAKKTQFSKSFILEVLKKHKIFIPLTEKDCIFLKDKLWQSDIQFIKDKHDEKCKDIVLICKKTSKKFKDYQNSSGIITEHLKKIYPDLIHPSNFLKRKYKKETGNYWHEQFFNKTNENPEHKETKKCKYCDWVTFDLNNSSGWYTTHLKSVHNKTINDYVSEFPEEKILFKTFFQKKELQNFIKSDERNRIKCEICGKLMRKITNSHLKTHNITLFKYRKQYGSTLSETTREKLSHCYDKINEKIRTFGVMTSVEKMISDKLNELNIVHKHEQRAGNFFYDFLLRDYDLFLETDGMYWHGHDRKSEWEIKPFNNIITDYKKSKYVKKIVRLIENKSINPHNLNLINSTDSFFNFLVKEHFEIKNHSLFNLSENQIIFSKKLCKTKNNLFESSGTIKNLIFLIKNFYYPEKYSDLIDLNLRATETSMLKAIFFKEFYKAYKKGNKPLGETFNHNNNLEKVIRYRLGLNTSNEFFDITLKNIYRGFETRSMFHVSIFPVNFAKQIYNEHINKNEFVFDPFAGWGSRLVGMKELINDKNCKYIGCDTNVGLISGYNKLKSIFFGYNRKGNISFNVADSKIFLNELKNKVDFIFTSPPFFNDEVYVENQEKYKNLTEWKEHLLLPVFKNCYEYLKNQKYIVIDMKEQYIDITKDALIDSGFVFQDIKEYNLNKSHYNKKSNKKQYLLKFQKKL
ncbi:MAG: hypothetical protein WC466_04145 [Candidatus Izemoplasmatales bacterium]